MDFEEELERFAISKRLRLSGDAGVAVAAKPSGHKFLPLLLRDLKRATFVQEVCFVLDGTIPVNTCVLHGRITCRLPTSKEFYAYMMDDGTANSEVYIYRHARELQAVANLQNQVDAMAARATLPIDQQMVQCLRRLLSVTETSLDGSCLAVGSKVFVFGRPSLYRGHISIKAISWARDDELNRDREIAFKDNLLDWYANKYPKMGAPPAHTK